MNIEWIDKQSLPSRRYICGYCGNSLVSEKGYRGLINKKILAYCYICHQCNQPTFFNDSIKTQTPGVPFGSVVQDVEDESVSSLYDEARNCCTTNSYTAAILCCRKLLMNIAVSKDADEGKNFIEYVDYLSDKNYVPPGGKEWVDHIRIKGNEANHEIAIMEPKDAEKLLSFVEMLLKFIYEYPAKLIKEDPKGEKPVSVVKISST